jgi:hypothetical protein
MKNIKGTFVGSFILGAVLLFLPAFAGAAPVPVSVHCTNSTTIASRLTAAAASASRTLFVTGTCVENVTVRNLRVIINGQHTATITPADPSKAAVTFTGGTTDATITGFTIETGNNGLLDDNGDRIKGGDGISVVNGAVVVVSENIIHVNGCGNGVSVKTHGVVTVNFNKITGNLVDDSALPNSACVGSTGLSISDSGQMALGAQKGATDNRNTVTGHATGIKCAGGGIVTGVKASKTNAGLGSAGGLSNFAFADNTIDGGVTSANVSGVSVKKDGTLANLISTSKNVGVGDGTTTPAINALVSCFTDL